MLPASGLLKQRFNPNGTLDKTKARILLAGNLQDKARRIINM